MRKIVLIAIVVLLVGATTAAADDEVLEWGIYGGFDVGSAFYDLRDFNDYFDDLRVMDFPGVVPLVGGQVYGILGSRFHLGFEGHMFSLYQQGMLADAHLLGYHGNFVFGYDAIARPQWRLRPQIGLGGTAVRLILDGVPGDFGEIDMPEGGNKLTYDKTAVLGRLGVTMEWTPTFYRDGNGLFGMACALTVGMLAPLGEDDWNIVASGSGNDEDVKGDGPDMSLTGGYMLLGIHFGGGIHTKDQTDTP
ncbi:MAG: hypothetical protein P9L99_12350 [Candidatus Lernaella stagnicola]|nr:hypothetical protein [Candidatus Lernaella stagnicola]